MIQKSTPTKKSGALFAAALLTGGIATALGGSDIGKTVAEKTMIELAPPGNPLCFFDGKLCFDLQERVRFEARNNNFDFADSDNVFTDDSFLLQRFRIGVAIKPAPWLKFYFQGQDSREFDSDRPNIPGALAAEGDDNFDLRQASIELGGTKDFPLALKIGRQILSFGDERLVGAFDWNNFGRTFDAARLTYKTETLQVDLFASSVVVIRRDEFNKSDLFNGNERDRQQIFSGLHVSTSAVPWGTAEAYVFLLNQKNDNNTNVAGTLGVNVAGGPIDSHTDFATVGGRLKGDPKKLKGWEFEVEGAYQNGQVRDQALNAFAVHAGLGYNWLEAPLKPRLWAEYNFGSGDTDATDDNTETFQNLFPTNHKFYGFMDLFSWQNLHNPMVSLRVTPAKNVIAQLDYHAFFLASNEDAAYRANGIAALRPLNDAARGANGFVGQELDFSVTWTVTKNVQLHGGYSHFFAGRYLDDTRTLGTEADDADFAYVQATLTF